MKTAKQIWFFMKDGYVQEWTYPDSDGIKKTGMLIANDWQVAKAIRKQLKVTPAIIGTAQDESFEIHAAASEERGCQGIWLACLVDGALGGRFLSFAEYGEI